MAVATALQLIVFCSFCFVVHSVRGASEYTRPPPRRIVSPLHHGSDSDPQQVHISLSGKDHVRVSWVTEDGSVPSVVEYGRSPGKYEATAAGEQTSYHFFFYKSGKIHHVRIGPLDAGTVYYYRCGGAGEEFNFRTPPARFPVEFVVAGDLGQTEWTASTLSHINRTDYDVLLLPGDLSYADNHQPLWDSFGRLVAPLAAARPWMVTEGNHELEKIPVIGPAAFKAYNSRWVMPFQESGSPSNLFYSFDVAGAHIVMLGSYTDFDAKSKQFQWLKDDLAGVDRRRTPWLVVLLHAPWYNTNLAHQGEGEAMREAMEELLYNARVDVVFAGHVHAYERFTRVYNNSEDWCGPVHITVGDGGNREGLALLFVTPPSPLSVFREASFGHGRLRILNETHAHWTWHRNDDQTAVVGDEVWLQGINGCSASGKKRPSLSSVNDEL